MSDIVERLRGQAPLNLGDRVAAAEEIDRLRATLERLREYAGHKSDCERGWEVRWDKQPCTCGYDELTAALATPSEEK